MHSNCHFPLFITLQQLFFCFFCFLHLFAYTKIIMRMLLFFPCKIVYVCVCVRVCNCIVLHTKSPHLLHCLLTATSFARTSHIHAHTSTLMHIYACGSLPKCILTLPHIAGTHIHMHVCVSVCSSVLCALIERCSCSFILHVCTSFSVAAFRYICVFFIVVTHFCMCNF